MESSGSLCRGASVRGLPLELIREIAVVDIQTYYALVRALPPLARWCLEHPDWMPKRFAVVFNGYTYVNGKLHCFDKPVIRSGDKIWFKFGKVHRDGEAAVVLNDGTKKWYKNGKLHRDHDRPAIVEGKHKIWYQNGLKHRDGDMPAQIKPDGMKYWYKNDMLHRDNGPAIIYTTGRMEWYRNGLLHRDGDEPAEIGAGGGAGWYKNGKPHRDGMKPALIGRDVQYWVDGFRIA